MAKDYQRLRIIARVGNFIKERFDLRTDKSDDYETIESIKRGVEFKGANLWVLIFAIFIASIGLNVNSTAVIIGAMLISPLMGPILGIGLGAGITDFQLIRKSLKNLGFAVIVSVVTSSIYFSISPLHDAQSELLARTTPTIWDVLIALLGGLAGIVAESRKVKNNAIPGAAIATALMPPLCTAGYGLAIGNYSYFFGAFYLFFINSVFISLSTYIISRILKYPRVTFIDSSTRIKARIGIAIFALITVGPSLYFGYKLAQRSFFENQINKFIEQELNFENCRVIYKNVNYKTEPHIVEVSLIGEHIPEEKIDLAKQKFNEQNHGIASLNIFQGLEIGINQSKMEEAIKSQIIEDLYKQNQDLLQSKDLQIKFLENEVYELKETNFLSNEVAAELKKLYPDSREFSINRSILTSLDSLKPDTLMLAYIKFQKKPSVTETKKIQGWLETRLKTRDLKVVIL